MSGADDRMRALMAGYRRAIAPRANDRARVWARLEDEPEHDAEVVVRRPRRTVAIAIGGAIAAALLLFAVRPRPAPVAPEARGLGHSVYDANVDPSPNETSTAAPRTSPTRHHAEQVAAPRVVPRAPPVLSPRRRAPTQRAGVASEDPLRGELQVVEAARAAIDRDDHDAALGLLREHGRRFPAGALTLEARSLRAIALCEAGRSMQGRGEAHTLLQERTSSPYRARLRKACELQ